MLVLFSIAGVAYYLIGYNLMYAGVDGGYIGSLSIWSSGIGSDSDLIGQTILQHLIGFSDGL